MRQIPLTQGKVALVSDCDYTFLMQWRWHYRNDGYASCNYPRRANTNEYKCSRLMHCIVARRKNLIGCVDHRNQNKLDNRRCNLRPGTKSTNGINRKRPSNNTTGYKGVYPHSTMPKWVAQIGVSGRRIYIGYYNSKKEAARAYNQAARKYFGPFADLNKV